MQNNNGFIKLNRGIRNHWIWENPKYLQWWIDLIMEANWTEGKTVINGQLITVPRGSLITSISKLAERWGCTRRTAKHFIDMLESDKMCTAYGTGLYTTISIEKYSFWQSEGAGDGTGYGTTDGTGDGTGDDSQYKKNKEDKESLSLLYIKGDERRREVSSFLLSKGLPDISQEFCDYYDDIGWDQIRSWKALATKWAKNEQAKPKPLTEEQKKQAKQKKEEKLSALYEAHGIRN